MACLIGAVGAEVTAYEAVPVAIVFTVELIFEMGGDFLGGVHFFESVLGHGDDFCFHFRADVFVLDDRLHFLALSHLSYSIKL